MAAVAEADGAAALGAALAKLCTAAETDVSASERLVGAGAGETIFKVLGTAAGGEWPIAEQCLQALANLTWGSVPTASMVLKRAPGVPQAVCRSLRAMADDQAQAAQDAAAVACVALYNLGWSSADNAAAVAAGGAVAALSAALAAYPGSRAVQREGVAALAQLASVSREAVVAALTAAPHSASRDKALQALTEGALVVAPAAQYGALGAGGSAKIYSSDRHVPEKDMTFAYDPPPQPMTYKRSCKGENG